MGPRRLAEALLSGGAQRRAGCERLEVVLMRLAPAVLALLLLPPAARAEEALTCDEAVLQPRSYALTTRAMARIVTAERTSWWDGFDLGSHEVALADLNEASTKAAERALELDPRNLMAHSILARQYVVQGEPELADRAWETVMRAGAPVLWTATLYDVDARTYFVLAFDRAALRIYRFEQLVGRVERGFYGIPKFPDEKNVGFWRAMGGCLDPAVTPDATIPWSDVREIKAGNWVLWFKLTRPVTVSSDRSGKEKTLREIKVNLHGRTGTLEAYKPVGEPEGTVALRGRGPAGYQDLVRRTLVKFVDPERRIALPPLKPGVGW